MAPLALLQEILKHKKVETVVIFTSKKILNFSLECFTHLNDCDDNEIIPQLYRGMNMHWHCHPKLKSVAPLCLVKMEK